MNYTLLTGATSSIGKEIAITLSKSNKLILMGRNAIELEELKELCFNSNNHFTYIIDFNDIDLLRVDFIEFIKLKTIKIENIIHCAGMIKVMHMKHVDLKNTNQIFKVNVFSIIEIISILLNKRVNDNCLKNIIFISAILAKYGSTGHHLYSSTKAALDGLMRSLAIELAPNTRVNSVLPGAVETKMSKELLSNKEMFNKLSNDYPLGIGKPKQISPIVKFLLSNDDSSWITGQELIVDGGRTININNK